MRFSLLTVLGITANAALLIVCFRQPESIWTVVAVIAWLVGVAMVVVVAASGTNRTRLPDRC